MMKVLVGCEESQAVCKAFRARGHEAFSCDLLLCSGGHPEWHLNMDVLKAIKGGYLETEAGNVVYIDKWDAGIFFPDCTYLTLAGNKWLKDQPARKSGALVGVERRKARQDAVSFFMRLNNCGIAKIAIENPIGVMSSVFRKPDQVIQPWQFGHRESKSTCLWLQGLPLLNPTEVVDPIYYIANGKRYSPTHYSSSASLGIGRPVAAGKERSVIRSKTFPGIAKAMADQWG